MPDNHSQFNYPSILQEASSTSFVSLTIQLLLFPQGQLMTSTEKQNQLDFLPASTTKHLCPGPLRTLLPQCSGCVFAPQGHCSCNVPASASGFPRSKTYCHVINIKSKQEQQKNNTPPFKPQVPKSFSILPYSKTSLRNDNTCLFSLKPTHSNQKLFPLLHQEGCSQGHRPTPYRSIQ